MTEQQLKELVEDFELLFNKYEITGDHRFNFGEVTLYCQGQFNEDGVYIGTVEGRLISNTTTYVESDKLRALNQAEADRLELVRVQREAFEEQIRLANQASAVVEEEVK